MKEQPKSRQTMPNRDEFTSDEEYSTAMTIYLAEKTGLNWRLVSRVSGEAKTPDMSRQLIANQMEEIQTLSDFLWELAAIYKITDINEDTEDDEMIEKIRVKLTGGSVPTPNIYAGELNKQRIETYKRFAEEFKIDPGTVGYIFNEGASWALEIPRRGVPTPSDEELQAEIQKIPYTKHLDDGQFNDGVIQGFELGAKWVKEWLRSSTEQGLGKDADKG